MNMNIKSNLFSLISFGVIYFGLVSIASADGGFISTANKIEVRESYVVIFYDNTYGSFPDCVASKAVRLPIEDIRADKVLSIGLAAISMDKKLHFTVYGCDSTSGMLNLKYLGMSIN